MIPKLLLTKYMEITMFFYTFSLNYKYQHTLLQYCGIKVNPI